MDRANADKAPEGTAQEPVPERERLVRLLAEVRAHRQAADHAREHLRTRAQEAHADVRAGLDVARRHLEGSDGNMLIRRRYERMQRQERDVLDLATR